MTLKEQISGLIERKLRGSNLFLVDVKVSPTKIFVFMDGTPGIHLNECIEMNRFLQTELENTDVFVTHELEVSSPGMEEPLKVLKQFQKRIGQRVRIILNTGKVREGILKSVTETGIEVEEKKSRLLSGEKKLKSKEAETQLLFVSFNEIKETRVVFSFAKM